MKKSLKVVLIIIAAFAVFMVAMVAAMFINTGKQLSKQVNVEIDMQKVEDGVYKGSSNGGLVEVEVEVEVKDHKIVNINLLKHKCGKGKTAESMLDEMVKNNTYDVDCVSGATASGKTIRNAVNKALQKGCK